MAANIMVSFVCAMQVDAFRKIKGSPYASTMCIGNLRSATEQLYRFRHTKDRECLGRCMRYYGVILMFAVGAVMGSVTTSLPVSYTHLDVYKRQNWGRMGFCR